MEGETVKNDENKKDKRVSKISRLKGLFKPMKTEDGRNFAMVGDKEYKMDNETGDYINTEDSDDRIPSYVFDKKHDEKKLKETV